MVSENYTSEHLSRFNLSSIARDELFRDGSEVSSVS
jgi:hypothetical protein